jgi:hypothetical protein
MAAVGIGVDVCDTAAVTILTMREVAVTVRLGDADEVWSAETIS